MDVRKLLITLILCASLGCAKKATAPIPGAVSNFDGTSYVTLMDTQEALMAIRDDVTTGRYVPTPEAKAVINQAIQDYDVAQAAWQLYHAGATHDQAALQSAINQIIVDIVNIADPHVVPPQPLTVPNAVLDIRRY